MTLRQRIRFFQQLAVLSRAGVSFRVSLERLKDRLTGRQLAILSQKVNEGERLYEAFEAAHFSPFECHLIAAGERGGKLDMVFERIAEFLKKELEMRQALMRPLYYPIAVMNLALVVGAIVETVMTSFPVALTHFIENMATLYVVGFAIFMVVKATWTSEAMRHIWLYVPIVGGSMRAANAYRWIMALRIEFIAGITISRAVGDAWRASGFVDSERLASEAEEGMRSGVGLSSLMGRWRQLPLDWVDFIETGEVSGGLEAAFTNLEAEAARSWALTQQRMSDWLPKIAYLIFLLIAAGMIFQIIAPVMNSYSTITNALDDATK